MYNSYNHGKEVLLKKLKSEKRTADEGDGMAHVHGVNVVLHGIREESIDFIKLQLK
jgi:hypothetical protein